MSDNTAKNKILKEGDSEAKKAVKKDYVNLYQDKFEPVKKDSD